MSSSRTTERLKYPNNSTSCNISRKSEFNGVYLSGALTDIRISKQKRGRLMFKVRFVKQVEKGKEHEQGSFP